MDIFAVERNAEDLNALKSALREKYPQAHIIGFIDPLMAMKAYDSIRPQLLACGYGLRLIDGLALAQRFRERLPALPVILVDDAGRHQNDAERMMMGYVSRPVTVEKLAFVR